MRCLSRKQDELPAARLFTQTTRKGHGSDSTLLVYNSFRNMLLEILYLAIATAVLLVPAGSSSCGGDVVVYV